jgi:TRAP-type mannitol/chloroaromatic compound transport system permease large subunit
MTAWVASNLAPLMFAALMLALLSGMPVVFALAGCGLGFAWLGVHLDLMPAALLTALPLRVFGILASELLLAIPFFTFMGLVLHASGLAEDMLETGGRLSGERRGALALAVLAMGALLAATTGVVAASVISMGTVSLPAMLRQGYHPRMAAGVVVAAGGLTQIIPPSLSLIVLADQLGVGVGPMYAAALLPAALIVAAYAAVILLLARQRLPAATMVSAPPAADGVPRARRAGAALLLAGAVGGWMAWHLYPRYAKWIGRAAAPHTDERLIVGMAVAALLLVALCQLDARFGKHLSLLTRRAIMVCAPPLVLIFLVLGTIYVGLATPTEAGALGAVGAVLIARKRLHRGSLVDVAIRTARLSSFVIFILMGSTVFTHTFAATGGNDWVRSLFAALPGGATGFLLFVTLLIFVLGLFLDFFEIAFVAIPLLAPVATHLGIDLVWFGVLVGINLQTSFLTPPFGYALFYLRNVAPRAPHRDNGTGRWLPAVSTTDIYAGAMPYVAVQVLVMLALIAWPALVTLEVDRHRLDDDIATSVMEQAADAGAFYNPGRPRPDPMPLLEQHLRETGAMPTVTPPSGQRRTP